MIGLIAWGRNKEPDGTRSANPAGLWVFLEQHAAEIAASFDFVQAPPDSLAQGGRGAGCDGYEVFEYRNRANTRYETVPGKGKEELMAASAALHAHGLEFWGDLPMHQMGGENRGPGRFYYSGRRGETQPGWFQNYGQPGESVPPFAPKDDIPSGDGAYAFGRVRSYQRSRPPGVVIADAKDILLQDYKEIGYNGFRWDDAKATNAAAVRQIMDSQPLPFYVEYFDGNPQNLLWYTTAPPMNGRAAAEDFPLHWRLQAACNGYDARLFDDGGWGFGEIRPDLSVAFVDNPDTDTSDGEQVVSNKGIAYALMLNLPVAKALVYGKDYYPAPVIRGGYGLKPLIDNLCWISRTFAFGRFNRVWVDKDVYAYTRDGNGGEVGWSGGLLVAVNFNTVDARTITVQTTWTQGTHVHDYTGHAGDAWVGPRGLLTITIPSNYFSNGQSYVCYARAGVGGAFAMHPRAVRQTFFGASDLLIKAASTQPMTLPERIRCAKGTKIHVTSRAHLQAGTSLTVTVTDPAQEVISRQVLGVGASSVTGVVNTEGWHSITVVTSGADTSFEIDVTYTHPR